MKVDRTLYSDTKEIVLCPPKYLSTDIANNKWMQDMTEEDRKINSEKAMFQFWNMYSKFAQYAWVWLLPPKQGFQDQTYVTNAAVVLPHNNKVVLANFKAQGRAGEELEVQKFLEMLGYQTFKCPYHFEGEAELKWLYNNIYIGGYGIRTDLQALEWIEQQFDCKIIKVEETDEYLYHLDCSVFPINHEYCIIGNVDQKVIREVKKYTKPIVIREKDILYAGITNSVRFGYTIFNASHIQECLPGSEDYQIEAAKNKKLIDIATSLGLDVRFCNLSEMLKSGALMSCCVLHLKHDYIQISLG